VRGDALPDFNKRLAEYNRRHMNYKTVVLPNHSKNELEELFEKSLDEGRNLIIYQDAGSSPAAVMIPWERYAELVGVESIIRDLAKGES